MIDEVNPNALRQGVSFNGIGSLIAIITSVRRDMPMYGRVLKYLNSGDIDGNRESVSGYISGIFYRGEIIEQEQPSLSSKDKDSILDFSYEVLKGLFDSTYIPTNSNLLSVVLRRKFGAIVSLRKNGELRGSASEPQPIHPLYYVISHLVRSAALYDPRFAPIQKEELALITIDITLIPKLKNLTNPMDFIPSREGLFLTSSDGKALLLPDLGTSYNNSKSDFLRRIC